MCRHQEVKCCHFFFLSSVVFFSCNVVFSILLIAVNLNKYKFCFNLILGLNKLLAGTLRLQNILLSLFLFYFFRGNKKKRKEKK